MSVQNLINILPLEHLPKIANNRSDLLNWSEISRDFVLPEEFIEKYKDYLDRYYISSK